MKTKEELSALKSEIETLNKKLEELTEEELAQVVGGMSVLPNWPKVTSSNPLSTEFENKETPKQYDIHIYKGTSTDFLR